MTVVEFLTSVIKGWEEHLATDPSDPIKVTRDLYVSLVTMAKAALLDAQALEAGLEAIAILPYTPQEAVPANPEVHTEVPVDPKKDTDRPPFVG